MNAKPLWRVLRPMICGAALLAVLAAWPASPKAQGFAGLGSAAEGFALPEPRALSFPEDHGAHPAFRIEWWYLTANLSDAEGTDYGVQWTLFRSAIAPERGSSWRSPQLWLGHAAITTPQEHFPMERFARDATGQADVVADPFSAWIDEWQMTAPEGSPGISALTLRAGAERAAYDLTLTADGPLIAHGEAGYSIKSEGGQASHYYSQPFYTVSGTLHLPDRSVDVTGQAWLDREWSSQPLEGDQTGWDWVSLHLSGGHKVMAARVRDGAGSYTFGTWITADGSARALTDTDITLTPQETHTVAKRTLPTTWRVELPAEGVDVTIEAVNRDAWMALSVPYWEGPVTVTGSHDGRGYLEMTGY